LALPGAVRRGVLELLARALPASRARPIGRGARMRKLVDGVHPAAGARAYDWMRKFDGPCGGG